MRFLLCASALSAQAAMPGATPGPPFLAEQSPRHSELTLAGLRPGKDKLGVAISRYGSSYRRMVQDSDELCAWVDPRRKIVLRVEVGRDGVIESVTVSAIDPLLDEPAEKRGENTILSAGDLATGRGLTLGMRRQRVDRLYGAPSSRGPSTQQGRELELHFYAFDRAPSDLPQVMEITLAAATDTGTSRVVQITLAFHSL